MTPDKKMDCSGSMPSPASSGMLLAVSPRMPGACSTGGCSGAAVAHLERTDIRPVELPLRMVDLRKIYWRHGP